VAKPNTTVASTINNNNYNNNRLKSIHHVNLGNNLFFKTYSPDKHKNVKDNIEIGFENEYKLKKEYLRQLYSDNISNKKPIGYYYQKGKYCRKSIYIGDGCGLFYVTDTQNADYRYPRNHSHICFY